MTSIKPGEENAVTNASLFTTLEKNPVPFDIAVSPTCSTATISWTGYSDSYEVKYRTSGYPYSFFEDFEDGTLPADWTTIDADGDGWNWYMNADAIDAHGCDISMYNTHSGTGLVSSASYVNNVGVLYPDNWLITPPLDLQGSVSAWLCGQDANYPAEHFAFYVSTTGIEIEDFIQISPEFVATGEYKEYLADLSAYAGQTGYIAIRHFNVSDQYWLNIDDFGILSGNPVPPGEWQTIETAETEVTLTGLENGTAYDYQIIGKTAGEADAATDIYAFSTGIPLVFSVYEDNYSIIDEYAGKQTDVTIEGRILKKDGRWWSLCLPFDVELEGSPLEGADIRTAESVTKVGDYIVVNCLTPVTKVYAGVPYILKWDVGKDIVNPEFKNVTISTGEDRSIYMDNDSVAFCGIYRIDSDDRDIFYILNGGLNLGHQSLETDATMYAFDCYFYVNPVLNARIEGIALNVGDWNETIVGIDGLKDGKDSNASIYNLAGQRISKMQKGINITGGRKILVK